MARIGKSQGFTAVKAEGPILPPSFLFDTVAALKAKHQDGSDYGLTKSLSLRDEMARYWSMARDLYEEGTERRKRSGHDGLGPGEKQWPVPLLKAVLGFDDLAPAQPVEREGRFFPLTHRACEDTVPMLLVARAYDLDKADRKFGLEGRRQAPHGAMQEFLNADDSCLWGVVSNGSALRLLRDNVSLTRPAYIEADLDTMFREDLYSDFAAFWLTAHESRLRPAGGKPSGCVLETWRTRAHEEGERAREHMRDGVTEALRRLGNGFLRHQANKELRARLAEGDLRPDQYYEQLLRLVYRFLFLFTTEERNLLHAPGAGQEARRVYREGYSLARLRDRALQRRHYDQHGDLWAGLLISFAVLRRGEPGLGLPALGGLFGEEHCPDLDSAMIENRHLLEAIRHLSYFRREQALTRINYRDMGTEELGSVYESLLEYHPAVDVDATPWRFGFVGDESDQEGRGFARKLTGSYYTPAVLVNELIRSALDPVLKKAIEEEDSDPRQAILKLKVIDPACGSGHFLLAAARRMAAELARLEAGDDSPDESALRRALRDVVQNCIYGVDRNPLAVELCRTALWIEAVEPGRPLTFLDPHVQLGNSLVGVLRPDVMGDRVPDQAYTALTGDDPEICLALRKRNRQKDASVQGDLFDEDSLVDMAVGQADFDELPEDTIADVTRKRRAWEDARNETRRAREELRANLFAGAFFAEKTQETANTVPLKEDFNRLSKDMVMRPGVVDFASRLASRHRFFHWHTSFAEVMVLGGFDVVLGNPPWERIKLQEKEFFSSRSPKIATAPNKAARGLLISALAREGATPAERMWHGQFLNAKREAESAGRFMRGSGRFPLTSHGDINTYAVFAETCLQLLNPTGRAGIIVQTGIATDNATQAFFRHITEERRLAGLWDFENREGIFRDVHRSTKFCLLTLGSNIPSASYVFFATSTEHLREQWRIFELTREDISLLNPNTKTASIFRSKTDAELTKKIYSRVPVLVDESKGQAGNPWGIRFATMFHMSNDSVLFRTWSQLEADGAERRGANWVDNSGEVWIPLMEAKLIHQFDHRWATYEPDGETSRLVTEAEKMDSEYQAMPRYWVPESIVAEKFDTNQTGRQGDRETGRQGDRETGRQKPLYHKRYIAVRLIVRTTDARTTLSSIAPCFGLGNSGAVVSLTDGHWRCG